MKMVESGTKTRGAGGRREDEIVLCLGVKDVVN